MNEANAQPMEASAESRLDERVERIRRIDEDATRLQTERGRLCEEVGKLQEDLHRKLHDAQAVVMGEYDRKTPSINGRY